MSVFVLKVEKIFDLSRLPEDNGNVFETREIVHLRDKSFAKFFISLAVRELDENLLTLFKKKTRDKIVIFGWILWKTVYCVRNKTLGVSRTEKGCFQCFDVAIKIGRDALSSVEGTSNTISFPFGGDF